MSSWHGGNFYLTQSQMEDNATLIAAIFRAKGWSDNAIAGMLGNMQSESGINPGIWENLDAEAKGGYGLVQWTPYTNYSNWAGSGWENNGPKECQRILYEFANGLQYYPTSTFPMTAEEYTKSTSSPSVLAYTWLYNYERPGSLNQPERATQAEDWFEFLGNTPTFDIPIWLLFKMSQRR